MRGPRPLTKKQEADRAKRLVMHRMRSEGHTREDIATAVDVPLAHVHVWLRRAVKMDGLPELPELPYSKGAMAEDPQKVGQVLALAMVAEATTETRNEVDKYKDLHQACKDAGLPPKIVSALLKRMRTTLAPVMEEGRKLSISEITTELQKKATMIMSYIDDFACSNANLKDLGIALSVMIEKHELLSGRPTNIIDFTSRQQLPGLMQQLSAEARRRGITMDGTATRVDESR